MITCKNCLAVVDLNYCGNCGQKASTSRLTIPGLIRDLPHAIFHVDKGFLFNFLHLFKRPGDAIQDYLAGKRKYFFHPATYLVLSLVINYVIVKITDLHFYDEGELISMDPVTAQAIRDYDAMQWWFLEHTYIYILLAIPASTLFLFAILKLGRQKFNMAESAVIVLFTIAQGVIIQSTLYLLFGWVPSGPFLRGLETVNMAILILYASTVIYQLLSTVPNKFVRISIALLAGTGLAVVWVASAFLLYTVME